MRAGAGGEQANLTTVFHAHNIIRAMCAAGHTTIHEKPSPGVYFWDVPPVFNLYLYSVCISSLYPWYPAVYPCIYPHPAILQQIHCILLYLTASSCIRTYLAVSSCIPLYLTVET